MNGESGNDPDDDSVVYSSRLLIRDYPANERPRERLRDLGAQSLSTPELLAILLRVGRKDENVITMATRLLAEHEGVKGLEQAAFHELASRPGLGVAKTAQIKAALELGRRLMQADPSQRRIISSPQDVYDVVGAEMVFLEHEELRVIVLNTRNHVIDVATIYRGTVNSSNVRVAEVFREAVRRNQPSMIVVHNHPSGDVTPSPDDERTTRLLVAAGKTLEIEVLDHVIIGYNAERPFISMRDAGLGYDR